MAECQLPKLNTRVRFPSLACGKIFMKKTNRLSCWKNIFLVGFLVMSSGCVSLPVEEEVFNEETVETRTYTEPERSGVYHKAQKGETIWRIAKAYNVAIPDIISMNNIPDVAQVEPNQLVFIPGATQVKIINLQDELENEEFHWPLKGKILRYYKSRDAKRTNKGIDIEAREGADVKAARSGNVIFADFLAGYGHMLVLAHKDGFHSVYAQNGELLVKLNDQVMQHQPIARVGRQKNGQSFLHFEIRRHALEENPLFYLP